MTNVFSRLSAASESKNIKRRPRISAAFIHIMRRLIEVLSDYLE